MENKMRAIFSVLIVVACVWAWGSILVSAVIVQKGFCNKNYPVNYIFYSKRALSFITKEVLA